jgi:hypothetical protein
VEHHYELHDCELTAVDRNILCRHKRPLIDRASKGGGGMRFDGDRLNISTMEAPWSFRSVEQNTNATIGFRKTNNYADLTAALGTAFDT